jgi:SagB-type dehydrogenase family enzyme
LRLSRHPDLLLSWSGRVERLTNAATGAQIVGEGLAEILEVFDESLSPEDAVARLGRREAAVVRDRIRALWRAGFLVADRARSEMASRLVAWRGNEASARYHAACRDLRYIEDPRELESFARTTIRKRPRPAPYKSYRRGKRARIPEAERTWEASELERTLLARRTVRAFRREPVSPREFARLLRMTFGVTAVLRSPLFGPLLGRTSPSGGGLHPIEAYPIVWNVRGVGSGVYHYDMAGNLARIRRGDFRQAAVEIASGQKWIARAAFLCVLTAVFPRVLWKYPTEDSYRTLFLDAGHLAQTFCLVATSLGLGPFTTAAMQDSKIEKLLQIDGIDEFPVYLCGAGLPARR